MTNPLAALEARLDALRAEWVGAAPAFGADARGRVDAGFDDVVAMSDAGLVRVLEVAGGLRRQLDGVLAALAAEVDQRSDGAFGTEGLAKQHGHRNASQLVAGAVGTTARHAAMLVRVGAATRPRASFTGGWLPPRRPAVAGVLEVGAIGVEAADAICSMLERVAPRTSAARAEAYERELAAFATTVPSSLLQRALTHAEARLDPDGVEPRDEALHEQRSLTFAEDASGMLRLHGRFDVATAAPVKAAIEQIVTEVLQRRRRATSDDGPEDDGPAIDDLRSIPQLQADALADLARHALGCAELPSVAKTTVVLRMSADALAAALSPVRDAFAGDPAAARDDRTRHGSAAPSTPGGLGSIDGFDRVASAATLRRMAADAEIIPVVLGGRGEPLDVGRAKRLFTRAQRVALAERDGGCASCGRNIGYVDAHHISWWERDTGPTDLDNGVLLCTHCHHQVHRDGWRILARRHEIWFVPPPHVDPDQRPRLGGRARFELRGVA
ncbi:HNH endonuclease signature motif containing protein [Agromyces italicus]|uniref:HNH endonuclease signature motif containing protein n=1 Tax=Agromyces italicus TaxID=279572 RepID=UPI0003B5F18A|nr:HNH endonuclease signature motif containing protein [Agromyces italicus]